MQLNALMTYHRAHSYCFPLLIWSLGSTAAHADLTTVLTTPHELINKARTMTTDLMEAKEDVMKRTSFKGSIVIGSNAADRLGEAVLQFLRSSEGKAYIWNHRNEILNSKNNSPEAMEQMAESFWTEFDKWSGANGFRAKLIESLGTVYKTLPAASKVQLELFYPKSSANSWLAPAIDLIANELAGPIAFKIRGGKIGTNIVANGIRRASNHGARLKRVQIRYDDETDNIREQIFKMLETIPRKTLETGIAQNRVKSNLNISVKALEDTNYYKTHSTPPKDSYFSTSSEFDEQKLKIAEGKLPKLDGLDFQKLIRTMSAR